MNRFRVVIPGLKFPGEIGDSRGKDLVGGNARAESN
jgi:hypothetical protein